MFGHSPKNKTLAQEIDQLYLAQKDQERQDIFTRSFPRNFYYYNLHPVQFENPDYPGSFKINDENVSKLILIREKPEANTRDAHAVLMIKFQDGKRVMISLSLSQAGKMETMFIEYGAVKEVMFSRKSEKNIPWNEYTTETVYQNQDGKNPEIYYDKLYAELIKIISSIRKNTKSHPMLVVDGGCGDKGTLLFKIETSLKENQVADGVQFMGFDFNESNIINCEKEKLQKVETNCFFLPGDLTKTKEVIDGWIKNNNINHACPVILTLSGSLTRLVLKDGFQGLECLKSIAQQGNIQYLIGGGVGEPLLNSFIMKQMGYKPIQVKSDVSKFFYYVKMTDEEVLSHRRKKLTKYNILDLSLCPDPNNLLEQLIRYLPESRQSITVDLSFTELNDDLIQKIHEIIKSGKNINFIFWHNNPYQVLNFYQAFMKAQNSEVSVESLKLIEDESYLMSSRVFFSSLHHPSVFNLNFSPDKVEDNIQMQMAKVLNLNIFNHDFSKLLFSNYVDSLIQNKNENVIEKSLIQVMDLRAESERKKASLFEIRNYVSPQKQQSSSTALNYVLKDMRDRLDCSMSDEYRDTLYVTKKNKTIQQINEITTSYVDSLEKKIFDQGDIKSLPLLIMMFQTGISVEYDADSSSTHQIFGKDIVKEVELYHRLAHHPSYAKLFSPDLMKIVAQRRLMEYKPEYSESAETLNHAKALIKELFEEKSGSEVSPRNY